MFRLKRIEWIAILVIVAGALALWWPWGEWGHRRFKQCILCRVIHIEHDYCGFTWEEDREYTCTEWYRRNVAASHDHLWVGCVTVFSVQNLFGQNFGWGSNVQNHPAEWLTSEQQIEVYEHIGNIAESTQLFVELRDHVLARHPKGRCIAMYLELWAEKDRFKTPWPEWKRKMDSEIEEWLKEIEANDEKLNGAEQVVRENPIKS